MTVWREVEEALAQRWADTWDDRTLWTLPNDNFDPQGLEHVRISFQQRPGGPETLGPPGRRKIERRGAAFAQIRVVPGNGAGGLSDLADIARAVWQSRRLAPHDIRLDAGQIGPEGEVADEAGRWWGVTVEVPFAYQDII